MWHKENKIQNTLLTVFLRLSLFQSVPKYLCPKCVGATGCTSVVKMVISGNSWIIDLAPKRDKRWFTCKFLSLNMFYIANIKKKKKKET